MSVEANNTLALRDWEAWKTGNWPSSMMTFATDDVFHDAAGGVGHGCERPNYRTGKLVTWSGLDIDHLAETKS
jgi:hypothetical protein